MIEMNTIEKTLFNEAKPYLSIRRNEIHTQNVIDFAFKLLQEEKGDRDIVIPAAILHDVGWIKISEDNIRKAMGPNGDESIVRVHEEEGVKIAEGILEKHLNSHRKISEILEIISGHDTREDALSMNDKIVKDADKLSRYDVSFLNLVDWCDFTTQELFHQLESNISKWFFLPLSKKIANEELIKRRKETLKYCEVSG
ncbi:HD domain-containing protein [Desulfobacula sp.]|uniref:HD domain-containing protein n=1 Tax=Desulfobacula sp. TaxID=2593537 RepID=UPI0026368532|nr:HD domain-containing protein [Desulfobacula sp.]